MEICKKKTVNFLIILNYPQIIASFYKMNSVQKFVLIFPEKSPRVLMYCFPIWDSDTKKAIH